MSSVFRWRVVEGRLIIWMCVFLVIQFCSCVYIKVYGVGLIYGENSFLSIILVFCKMSCPGLLKLWTNHFVLHTVHVVTFWMKMVKGECLKLTLCALPVKRFGHVLTFNWRGMRVQMFWLVAHIRSSFRKDIFGCDCSSCIVICSLLSSVLSNFTHLQWNNNVKIKSSCIV